MIQGQENKIKEIIQAVRKASYIPEAQAKISDAEVLGLIVSQYLRWDCKDILKTVYSALEDSNMHTLNAEIEKLVAKGI
jgi:hypothetical protein